jgi:hypothetical protein
MMKVGVLHYLSDIRYSKKRGGGVLGDAVALGDGGLRDYADLGEGNSAWPRELSGELVIDWRYGFA